MKRSEAKEVMLAFEARFSDVETWILVQIDLKLRRLSTGGGKQTVGGYAR
jgi:hypothetical protein